MLHLDIHGHLYTITELRLRMHSKTLIMNNTERHQNNSNQDLMQSVEDYLLIILMIISIAVTVIGNIFVIVAVLKYKPLRNVQNVFLISLAVADLAVAILVMPLHISNNLNGKWLFGGPLCEFWLTCDVLLCTASILNLCVIALDRYFAIHDPLKYAQKRTISRVMIMIFSAWVASAVISVPPLFGWSDSPDGSLFKSTTRDCSLTSEKGYVIYSSCGSFFIPLGIMLFVYVKIFFATRERLRKRAKASAASKMALFKNRPPPSPNLTVEHISEDSNDNHENQGKDFNFSATPNHSSVLLQERTTTTSSMEHFFNQKQKISISKERKAARTLGIIVGAFVLCWLPFFLMYVILPFCSTCHLAKETEIAITFLGYVNSAINPIIYTVFNVDFRKAFIFLFGKYLKCKNDRKQQSSISSKRNAL